MSFVMYLYTLTLFCSVDNSCGFGAPFKNDQLTMGYMTLLYRHQIRTKHKKKSIV